MRDHKHQEDKGSNTVKEFHEKLKISTLNYSGVLTSPYEFFESESQRENKMSETFAAVVSKKYPQFMEGKGEKFSWDMGSIDTKWNNRYAPINILEAGVNKDTGFMMNQQQFSKQWEKVHAATRDQIKKEYFDVKYKGDEIQKRMQTQIQKVRQFDLFTYKTLMKVYCNIDDISKISKVDSKQYLQQRKQDFKKPYLSEELKLDLTIKFIDVSKIDVLFFQETNKNFVNDLKSKIKNYYVITKPNVDSIILIKKSFCKKDINFEQQNKSFLTKYSQALETGKIQATTPQNIANRMTFNKDSIFQAIDNLLLIDVHISSKKDKNPQQQKQIAEEVTKILKYLPKLDLVCGGDFNANIDTKLYQKSGNLQFVINSKEVCTVNKKRTYMQPQRNKALKLDQDAKDHFISNRTITNAAVELVSGVKLQKDKNIPLLPNKDHPYDHYMVVAEIDLHQKDKK